MAGRLYYAVAEGLQIWSVAIRADGSFGADARMESQRSPSGAASEISKITFDDPGRMLLAERPRRPAPTISWRWPSEASAACCAIATYPAAGGPPVWQPRSGRICHRVADANAQWQRRHRHRIRLRCATAGSTAPPAAGSCGRPANNCAMPPIPALCRQLAASGPATSTACRATRRAGAPANVPPLQSYFVDYDDQFSDDNARGHIGDIAIWRICGQTGFMLPGWFRPRVEMLPGFFWYRMHGKKPPQLDCPPGSGNQCACPPGTTQQPGFQCCPLMFTLGPNGQCQSPCPDGSSDPGHIELCLNGFDPNKSTGPDPSSWTCLDGSKPVPDGVMWRCPIKKWLSCPAGFVSDPNNTIGCTMTPAMVTCNQNNNSGDIIQIGLDGSCQQLCPHGTWAFQTNQCCPDGTLPGPDGKCGKPQQPGCPPEQLSSKGICCPAGSKPQPDGSCYPMKKPCPPEQLSSNGTCCPLGTKPQPDGSCGTQQDGCPPGQMSSTGQCCLPGTKPQPDGTCRQELVGCPPGTSTNQQTGECCLPQSAVAGVAAACTCPPDTVLVNGKCIPNAPPVPIKQPNACFVGYVQLPNGSCCLAAQATESGQCCPAGQKPDTDKRKCVPAGGARFRARLHACSGAGHHSAWQTRQPGICHAAAPAIGRDSAAEALRSAETVRSAETFYPRADYSAA